MKNPLKPSARAIGIMLVAILCPAAFATPLLQQQFTDVTKLKPGSALDLAKCKSYHTSPPKLNPSGRDLKAEMTRKKSKTFTPAVWKALGRLDSDKDGVSNRMEVEAGTLPGDPSSKPHIRVQRGESRHPPQAM
jgi:hypothetical protein